MLAKIMLTATLALMGSLNAFATEGPTAISCKLINLNTGSLVVHHGADQVSGSIKGYDFQPAAVSVDSKTGSYTYVVIGKSPKVKKRKSKTFPGPRPSPRYEIRATLRLDPKNPSNSSYSGRVKECVKRSGWFGSDCMTYGEDTVAECTITKMK